MGIPEYVESLAKSEKRWLRRHDIIWGGESFDIKTENLLDSHAIPETVLKDILWKIVNSHPNGDDFRQKEKRVEVAFSRLVGRPRKTGTVPDENDPQIMRRAANIYLAAWLKGGKDDLWKACIGKAFQRLQPERYEGLEADEAYVKRDHDYQRIMDKLNAKIDGVLVKDLILLDLSACDTTRYQNRLWHIHQAVRNLCWLGIINHDLLKEVPEGIEPQNEAELSIRLASSYDETC